MKTKLPKEAKSGSKLEDLLAAQLHYAGFAKPVTQHKFHPTRKWKFDLAWPESLLACEIHGGTWTAGRHVRGGGFQSDREKMNEAQILGWVVLEFTERDVRTAGAIDVIERAMQSLGVSPLSSSE